MQPKRTVVTNYYDCYEVGYVLLHCVGRGDPAGQSRTVITRTLNLGGVQRLADFYGIKFVDNDNIYATGYYIKEVETTVDPDTFENELDKLELVFMKEVELKQLKEKADLLFDKSLRFYTSEEEYEKADKEYTELKEKIDNLDYELHGRN